ncbi:MAG: AsmA-like C-terminal domain-containing protein, partial [Kordiimonas sp.]
SGGVTDLLGGEGLKNADLTLNVNADELTTSGFGDVNGVPMELYWREDFAKGRTDQDADTSLLVMSGSPDEDDIAALGVDISSYIEGRTRAEATFLGRNLKFRVGYFSADASDAKLMISPIGWSKSPSSPASINGTMLLSNDGVELAPLLVTGEGVDLTANFKFGSRDSGTYNGKVTANMLGRNKLLADISKVENQPLKIMASGEVFDAAPLLARTSVSSSNENVAEDTQEEVDFDLLLHADTLILQNGEQLRSADLKLVFKGGEPTVLDFRATDSNGETSAYLSVTELDLRPLSVSSGDAGSILRGLGLFAHMQGGSLVLESETDSWGDTLTLNGTLTVNEASLISKSNLDAEVTEGVISGLDDYLNDGSVKLDVTEVPFSYVNGLLDISNLKANGPSLGMTMEGQIQTSEQKINVNGVVVPAYGLNSLLGKIPLVGSLFSGGSGKGLFGVTYRVKGSTEAPEVSVNALSGLAPGFLRILFEGRKGKVSDVEGTETVTEKEQSSDLKEKRQQR